MYAIVEIAGQQFKVAKDQKLFVHRLTDKEGSKVSFDKVYLLDDKKKVVLGAPTITGASVEAKVVSHLKGDKVIVFKKKRRTGYRVKNGHRQALTELVIENIQVAGAQQKTKIVKKTPLEKVVPSKAKAAPLAKKPPVKNATIKKESFVDFSKMNVAELKAEAKKKGVDGISAMKKAELIMALSK